MFVLKPLLMYQPVVLEYQPVVLEYQPVVLTNLIGVEHFYVCIQYFGYLLNCYNLIFVMSPDLSPDLTHDLTHDLQVCFLVHL